MAELADALASGASLRKEVQVQVLLSALKMLFMFIMESFFIYIEAFLIVNLITYYTDYSIYSQI